MSEDRKTFLGGSEIAAVAGVSRYEGPHDVWSKKLGLVADEEDNRFMLWGRKLEDLVGERYTEVTGKELIRAPHLVHPKLPYVAGTPDRLIVGEPRLLEIKTADARSAHLWGEEGTDGVPASYLCQVAYYLALTNLEAADVAVLIGGNDFRVFHVERDRALEDRLLELARDFWTKYVVPKVPPPIDASLGARRYLAGAFPREASPVVEPANPEEDALAVGLKLARMDFRRAQQERQRFENLMKERLGGRAGIEGEGYRITWRRTKDREAVNWEAVAKGLLKTQDKATADALVSLNTIKIEGHRRFRAKYEGEDKDDE